MQADMTGRGLFVGRDATAAGDAQFLDPDRPYDVQIRPMLKSERPLRAIDDCPSGAHWVVFRSPSGKELRALVKIPFNRRKNTRANAEFAVEKVEQFNSVFGALFRLALRGVDPFVDEYAIVFT